MNTTSSAARAASATPLVKSVSTDILNSIARHLKAANVSLAQLVLVEPAARTRRPRQARAKRTLTEIPVPLAARMQKPRKVAKAAPEVEGRHYLDATEKKDIALLLERTSIPVAVVASMFCVSRAAIYNLRDRLNLDSRRGSDALMAGVRRLHAKRAKPVAASPIVAPDEIAPVAAPVALAV